MKIKLTLPTKYIWLLGVSVITFVISLGVFVYFLSNTTNLDPKKAEASSYSKDQIIASVNKERKQKNLSELVENSKLDKAAQAKANDMADKSYFSHVEKESGKRWSDFIKEVDYDYVVAGENLANGFYAVDDMVTAWMESPTHKENILNEGVDETGIGISFGQLDGTPTIFVVQVFGKE
jgi:uncharacterized protein YkwD